MEKKCFIMMPTGEQDGYAQGHFSRVYQYIIVPACKSAGFSPIREDDPTLCETATDMLRIILDSDIVICDVSSKRSNTLYGFVIRQATNLPVTLIKDTKTQVAFNTLEFDGVEYDESLRIDTVQNEIEMLGNVLKKTFANKSEINSLLNRFNIGSASIPEPQNNFVQAELTEKKESHLPIISPLPDYVGDPINQHEAIDKLKVGDSIFHMNYGKGDITSIKKMGKDKIADFHFESGSKTLVLVTSGLFRKIKA